MASEVQLLTFVGNKGWETGPGHMAIGIGNTCYTFEDFGNGRFNPDRSGWLILNLTDYLKQNEYRPTLIQKLKALVVPGLVTEYVRKSVLDDDDFVTSGWCSYQAAKAIDYASPKAIDFDPDGLNTPQSVFYHARRVGIAASETYVWRGRGALLAGQADAYVENLETAYKDVADILLTQSDLETNPSENTKTILQPLKPPYWYTVKAGLPKEDWPSSRAGADYGDVLLWPLIFEATREQERQSGGVKWANQNKLHTGQRIFVPDISGYPQAKISAARTRGKDWRRVD